VLIVDTCVLIYDSLRPDRLTNAALDALDSAESSSCLACAGISLWELAMLVEKGRLETGIPAQEYIELVLAARKLQVLPVSPEIASLSASLGLHSDPADRIIAASAISHQAPVVTSDRRLINFPLIETVW
jgi:PIN domain nuclease of toxin-antitoxin system